ncbi:acyltransferase family protein [Enterobacter mori]|uniref:acyltransferase family protein n=1 Tax=Enterobacter mori TaxID=539813 RepID=UPI0021C7EDCF|nr:acyltransferase [Enterobacter mori]MCU3986863.1 acyltransferase [Enterobacter mori]
MGQKFVSLQYLRAFAAIFVVLFHFRNSYNGLFGIRDFGDILFQHGKMGVDIFFIISGFIIAMSTENNSSKLSYVVKRIFRIWPVYILACVTMFYISGGKFNAGDFLKAIFFIPFDAQSSAPQFGYSLIAVAWTLTYEVLFYIIFLLAMFISHKHRNIICVMFMLSFCILTQSLTTDGFSFGGYSYARYSGGLASIINPLSCSIVLEFCLGVAIYELIRILDAIEPPATIAMLLLTIIGVIVLSYKIIYNGQMAFHGLVGYGSLSAMIVMSALLAERLLKVNDIKSMTIFGDSSYSIYLWHLVIYSFMLSISNKLYNVNYNMLFDTWAIFAVPLVLLASVLSYKYIELPFIKLGHRICAQRKTLAA